jgi:prepilin-type N-terminal cleavage/methylation domain-containing protein
LQNTSNNEKRRLGFTYIELLISLSIMAIIFSAILPLIFNSITSNRGTRLKLIAYEAASQEIETLREQKVSSLVSPSHVPFTVDGVPGAIGDVYINKALGDEKIAAVTSKVTWTYRGKEQTVQLNTYLYGSTE